MKVPLLDLKRQWQEYREQALANVTQVLDQQACVLGPWVAQFEKAVAEYCHVPYAVGCASGTDAILLGLRALGVEDGEEVITTPYTFFATAGAVVNAKGRPVFVDIDPATYNIDPELIEDAVTERTRVIAPVHLFGQCAEMDPILDLAERTGLRVLEDAAQAIGAADKGRPAGTMGDVGTFSFYPSKNLGGVGDGGMMVARTQELDERLRQLRHHGGKSQYRHDEVGWNSRLDAVQAAVLSVKLPLLESWTEGRRANARFYDQALAGIDGLTTPAVGEGQRHIYNQYVVRTELRDQLKDHLTAKGVGTAIYYPLPLHLQACFADLGYKDGQFPESERAAKETLSIPVNSHLTEEERDHVAQSVRSFFQA